MVPRIFVPRKDSWFFFGGTMEFNKKNTKIYILSGKAKSGKNLVSKIIERYYNDKSQQETSRELGISQVQVSRNEAKILTKLRGKLAS